MSQDRTQRKLVVIVHADVAGYSSLMARDEDLAHRRVSEAFNLLSEVVARYGGRIAEKRGDALLAASYGHLGKASEARAALEGYRLLSPIDIRERTTLFHKPEYRQLFLDGIALADGFTFDSDSSAHRGD